MIRLATIVLLLVFGFSLQAQDKTPFQELDVFELEWVVDPTISPDGSHIIYRRMGMDIMKDRRQGNLWIIERNGSNHQKLTSYDGNESQAVWSPSGDRIAFVRGTDQGSELFIYWMNSKQIARISQLPNSPGGVCWSPDGSQLAFSMKVDQPNPVLVKSPNKPKGAEWADAPRVTDRMYHERDGSGYFYPGFTHIFTIPAEGGSPRKVSSGDYHHRSPVWSLDGQTIYCSGNRSDNWEYEFRNSEIYAINLVSGGISTLTDRNGPDHSMSISPNGQWIAYQGYTDQVQTYQLTRLHLMKPDGSGKRVLLPNLDRSVDNLIWDQTSEGIYFLYDDHGHSKIGYTQIAGDDFEDLVTNVGGSSMGRPYSGGSFSMANDGSIAYNTTTPLMPGELAIYSNGNVQQLTDLNSDLLANRTLGETKEIWYKSSFDERDVQGWIVTPPDFDPSQNYPLIVENHGGPISNYGWRFSPEMQLMAAAGYVVFYPNPRGSTSYGEEFGNLLYHNYPGNDYDDVMSGVDAVIDQGYIDTDQLFVTGGSAGGIMSAWIIGKTDRFAAAAVVKPVMNWYSKTLAADNWFNYYNYRFPGLPWTNTEEYMGFSPISLVGNVTTPTLVMVGMNDLRTPPFEAKQLYHALKYRKIETMLVEIPGSYHFIANRPSQLITKIAHVVAWFEQYRE